MKLILSLLVFGILFSGCICPQTGTPETGNGAQVAGNGQQATGNGTPTTGPGTTVVPDDATIATYTAAVAAGVPLQCTVTQQGMTTTFFIKGQNMYMTGTSNNVPFDVVVKNDIVYMKMSSDMKQSFTQMGKTCDWLQLSDGSTSGSTGSASPVSPSDYQAPNVVWTCSPSLFGDEKFVVNGGICNMQDLTGGYPTN